MCCEFLVTRSSFLPSLGPWLRGLLSDSTLADVSLACGDLVAPAHRVVLASSSRVFSRMLRAAPASTHTVIHLQGVPPAVGRAVLEYIYLGETQVPEELLHSFLTTATDLQLEGLVGGAGEDKVKEKENEVEEKQGKEVKEKEDVAKEKEEDTEYEVIKVKNSDEVIAREFAEIKGHSCNICGKVLIHRSSLKRHMDKLHKKTEETVPITPLRSRGRSGVRREVVTKHLQGIVEAGEDEVVTVREEGVETRAGVEEEVEKARPRSKSTPGEPGTLSCPLCGHTVPTRRRHDLKRHMMRVHAAQYNQTSQ